MNHRATPIALGRVWLARAAFAALAAAVAAVGGCSPARKVLIGNIPPETVITVTSHATDPLRVQNHRVQLHWFGSDPDGEVVAFEIRMLNFLVGNSVLPADSVWVRLNCASGDCNDSLFTIPAPNGAARAQLEVRAIDNNGAADPEPATQNFSFLNTVPICRILSGPLVSDSSYATVSISWNVDDRGGDLSRLSFRVYLGGNEANYDSVYTGTSTGSFTVPSRRFVEDGWWKSHRRTVFVRAVDDGGQVGPAAGLTWYVRSPGALPGGSRPTINSAIQVVDSMLATSKGRALLVDNSFRALRNPNDVNVDNLYAGVLRTNLVAGTFSILRLDVEAPFRTAADLAQTFRQFDGVIWYRGFDSFAARTLTAYQDSVAEYLRHGGRFFLEGLNMVEGPGLAAAVAPPMLRESFTNEFLNSLGQRKYFTAGDSSVAWGTRNYNDVLPPFFRSSTLQDSMLMADPSDPGIRVFIPRDSMEVAFWAKPNALQPVVPENLAVVMSVRQPSGGRMVAVPFPVRETRNAYAPYIRTLTKLLFHPTSGLFAP